MTAPESRRSRSRSRCRLSARVRAVGARGDVLPRERRDGDARRGADVLRRFRCRSRLRGNRTGKPLSQVPDPAKVR